MRIRHILLLTLIAISGCGGGGGTTSPVSPTPNPTPTTGQSQGTAAGGIAMSSATISVKCQDGSTFTTSASVSGAFAVTVSTAAYPCLLQATKGVTALRSVTLGAGVVNITPLTEMVVARLGGMPAGDYFAAFPSGTTGAALKEANVASAQTAVKTALSGVADLSVIPDLIKTPFTAATASSAGDTLDKALDAVNTGLSAKGLSVSNVATAFARGSDATTIKALVSSGNADALANVPFTKAWTQGRQRSGGGGRLLTRIDGTLHSYGSEWLVSTDNGASWKQRFAPISPIRMTSFNGRLIFAGGLYSYRSSADAGQTWEPVRRLPGAPNSANNIDCFVQSAGRLFATTTLVGAPVWVSTDGLTFEVATAADIATVTALLPTTDKCPGGILPNDGPRDLLSDDGYVHDPLATGSKYFRQISTPIPGLTPNTLYPRNYNYRLEISSDKAAWAPITVATYFRANLIAELSPGRFVTIGERENDKNGRRIPATYLSTDGGITWADVGGGPAITSNINDVASIGNNVVAVGWDTLITRSADGGMTWSDVVPANTSSANLAAVEAGNSVFVAVGEGGTILRSSDGGATWTQQSSGITEDFRDIAFGGGKFVAVSSSGKVLTSVDGTTWTLTGTGLTAYGPLQVRVQLAYGNGSFVATVATGVCIGSACSSGNAGVFSSQDGGATWSRSNLSDAFGVAYGNGYFIAQSTGDSSNIWISTDLGRTWLSKGSAPTTYMRLSYGGGIFATAASQQDPITGYYSLGVSSSLDGGITWKFYPVPGGVGENLFFTGTRWIGVGQSNTVVISSP